MIEKDPNFKNSPEMSKIIAEVEQEFSPEHKISELHEKLKNIEDELLIYGDIDETSKNFERVNYLKKEILNINRGISEQESKLHTDAKDLGEIG